MNAYKHLSNKGKDITRNETYTSIITNSLNQMFKYNTDMSDMSVIRFENILISTGMATLYEWHGKTVPMFVKGAGMLQPDDTFEYYTATFINGTDTIELPNDYPICYNTGDKRPALNILRFADMLSEVDLSMVFNLQRSRLAPIPIAKNDHMRAQLQNILESVKNGNYSPISSEFDLTDLDNAKEPVEIISLNDPKAIEYMNYLSELHDCLTRRLYTMYGMAVQETSKHAQVNEDESNARDGVSWLIPDNMLRMRKNFIDAYNKYTGKSFSVEYDDLFKCEREIMENRKEGESNETKGTTNTDTDSIKSDNNQGTDNND